MKPFLLLDASTQGNTSYLQKRLTKCWENLPVSSSLPLPGCTTPTIIVLKKVIRNIIQSLTTTNISVEEGSQYQ